MYIIEDGTQVGSGSAQHMEGNYVIVESQLYKVARIDRTKSPHHYFMTRIEDYEPIGVVKVTEPTKTKQVMKSSWSAGAVVNATKLEELVETHIVKAEIDRSYNLGDQFQRLDAIKKLRNFPQFKGYRVKQVKEWVENLWIQQLGLMIISHE